MSHYIEGKLALKCSIDLLRRALINIMPSWENHIRVDPEGRIPIYGYGSQGLYTEKTFHVMVPGPRNPNYAAAPDNVYADLGLRREEDGSWTATADRGGMRKIKNLEEQLMGELQRMKARAWAKLRGARILQDTSDENSSEVLIEVDKEDAKRFLKA